MEDINLGELGHKLKSPLVTIKSLAFILRNKADKKDKNLIKDLEEIEKKTDILNLRIDELINYLEYQKGEVEFLYEIFDVLSLKKEIQKNFKVKTNFSKQIVIADKGKLILALSSFLRAFNIGKIQTSVKKNQMIFSLFFSKRAISITGYSMEIYIARRIIELHGGFVKKEVNRLEVIIPQKPSRKK